jgi:hypothetical protein
MNIAHTHNKMVWNQLFSAILSKVLSVYQWFCACSIHFQGNFTNIIISYKHFLKIQLLIFAADLKLYTLWTIKLFLSYHSMIIYNIVRYVPGQVVKVIDFKLLAPHCCVWVQIPSETLNSFLWGSYPARSWNVSGSTQVPIHAWNNAQYLTSKAGKSPYDPYMWTFFDDQVGDFTSKLVQ